MGSNGIDIDGTGPFLPEVEKHDLVDVTSASTMNTTHRSDRSLLVRVLQAGIRPFKPHVARPTAVSPPGSPRLRSPFWLRKHLTITERNVEGVWVYDIVCKAQYATEKAVGSFTEEPLSHREEHTAAEAPRKLTRNRLVYFSGGCWQMMPSSRHWSICASLALSLPNTVVSIVSYPLAPKNPAPTTFPQLVRVYRQLFETRLSTDPPERITFMGDSAGANIAAALTLDALTKDPENAPAPESLLLISPSVDLTRSNPEIWKSQVKDPLLTAKFVVETAANWASAWPREDPRLSPLFADLSLLARRGVRVNGVVGGVDLLGADARVFRDKVASLGVKGEWLDWDGLMHCWVLFPGWLVKESRTALKWIEDVLRKEMDADVRAEVKAQLNGVSSSSDTEAKDMVT